MEQLQNQSFRANMRLTVRCDRTMVGESGDWRPAALNRTSAEAERRGG
jgi:hypothetical protein